MSFKCALEAFEGVHLIVTAAANSAVVQRGVPAEAKCILALGTLSSL